MTETLPIVDAESSRDDGADMLTGMANIGAARTAIAAFQDASATPKHDRYLTALITLGQIERLNLAFGREFGDTILSRAAARMRSFQETHLTDPLAIAARVSGDTFLIGTPSGSTDRSWQALVERLGRTLSEPMRGLPPQGPSEVRLAPRIGLVSLRNAGNPDDVFAHLANALYDLRRSDSSRVQWCDDGDLPLGMPTLEIDFLQAIERHEIEVLFQPQYDARSNALAGGEALVRWNHAVLGRLGSGRLLALARRTEHTAQLSEYVRRAALAAASEWPDHVGLSLNATAFDLSEGDYAHTLLCELETAGLAAQRLTLELTEQVLIDDLAMARSHIETLADRGIRFALDDFGAGYCNFRYLKELPLDWLKLDRSLLESIETSAPDRAVVSCIVAMADTLGLQVCAEGVETEAQRVVLVELGCAAYQGFLRSEAVVANVFHQLTLEQG